MQTEITIQMLTTIRPPAIFASKPGTVLAEGETYQAVANKHGAISGICENGEVIGVRPGEFKFITAPAWVVELWKGLYRPAVEDCTIADI